MNANELADELDTMLKAIGLTDNRVPTMLRQQEVEIERITSKYEEILHEQQAEIEALKKELALWRLSKSSEEIEATESDKFCDSHCVWTDHHPECKHAKYRR